jgi:hypothetical protein
MPHTESQTILPIQQLSGTALKAENAPEFMRKRANIMYKKAIELVGE